jgi:secreted PhoX family phosphatase
MRSILDVLGSNRSSQSNNNNFFDDLVDARLSRRGVLQGSLGLAALSFFGCVDATVDEEDDSLTAHPELSRRPLIGFSPIGISKTNQVVVPEGYEAIVLLAWGDPVSDGPAFLQDASNTAEDQAVQAGMGHDGMSFFPLPRGSQRADHGLLAINFEYTDDGLLHPDGMLTWTAEKVQKSKNAHGVGVVEVRFDGEAWAVVRPSSYARRITADTPMELRGPAAGHPSMCTAADPEGTTVLGTFNNCAGGQTPWGTYLTCEENFTPYFINRSGNIPPLQERYGVDDKSWGFRWHEFDPRFDAALHPNEPNRHGWVVEIDPYDPTRTPVKRTAMGRLAHEGATLAMAADRRVVYYMGDDDFRSLFEHIYKFVSDKPCVPGGGWKHNHDVLDSGTLYAARFNSDGTGEWIPLVYGQNGLTADNGFASQAEVLINARGAADAVGATFMDRPEWIAVHPRTREVYCTLTNNTKRGTPGQLGPDAANPRGPNLMGHIIRWREEDSDPTSTRFTWDIFLLAGDPAHADPNKRGNVQGGVAFAQPDGLSFDERGVLWIQTDSSAKNMATADWTNIGNNQMLAADPRTGEVRRFLTGVVGCEITGNVRTPDGRTMFVNIQHPGEPPLDHPPRNNPNAPKAVSDWPDGAAGGRPRSATLAIRRKDGRRVGT